MADLKDEIKNVGEKYLRFIKKHEFECRPKPPRFDYNHGNFIAVQRPSLAKA